MDSVSGHIDEQTIRRFLLGELSDTQQVELEQEFFEDDNAYRQILAIQEELADDYVRNHLGPDERNSFVQNFLRSSLRRERVDYAAAFARALEIQSDDTVKDVPQLTWMAWLASLFRPSLQFAIVSSVLVAVLLAGLALLVIQNRRLANRAAEMARQNDSLRQQAGSDQAEVVSRERALTNQLATEREQANNLQSSLDQKQRELDQLKAELASENKSAVGTLATFVLSAGLRRGEDEPEKLIIPLAAKSVQLQLSLEREESFKEFIAEVRTARGNLVWSRRGLKSTSSNNGAVSVTFPASLLTTGEYEITLKGSSPRTSAAIAYYYIIALKR